MRKEEIFNIDAYIKDLLKNQTKLFPGLQNEVVTTENHAIGQMSAVTMTSSDDKKEVTFKYTINGKQEEKTFTTGSIIIINTLVNAEKEGLIDPEFTKKILKTIDNKLGSNLLFKYKTRNILCSTITTELCPNKINLDLKETYSKVLDTSKSSEWMEAINGERLNKTLPKEIENYIINALQGGSFKEDVTEERSNNNNIIEGPGGL